MPNPSALSASIVLYENDSEDILTVIKCFLGSSAGTKLFLIDNSPTEKLKTALPADSRIEYEHNPANTGYPAHNIAMKRSIEMGFKYHIVLNPDLYFEPSILSEIVRFMDENPDIGLLIPKVYYTNGELQYACKLLPTPADFIARLCLPKKWIGRRMNRFELRLSGYDKMMDVPYVSGCFMFLRNRILKEVGFFDERFFMYAEDIDFSRRIHAKYRVVYFPDVSIIHKHAADSYKNWRLFKIHATNVCQYFNKYGWFFDKHRKKVNRAILSQFDA